MSNDQENYWITTFCFSEFQLLQPHITEISNPSKAILQRNSVGNTWSQQKRSKAERCWISKNLNICIMWNTSIIKEPSSITVKNFEAISRSNCKAAERKKPEKSHFEIKLQENSTLRLLNVGFWWETCYLDWRKRRVSDEKEKKKIYSPYQSLVFPLRHLYIPFVWLLSLIVTSKPNNFQI